MNAEWRTICDETWDLLDAEVACKQLGMGYALVAVIGAGFGQGTVPSLSRRLNCTGSETSLLMCPQSSGATCQHSRDAGVVCSDACKSVCVCACVCVFVCVYVCGVCAHVYVVYMCALCLYGCMNVLVVLFVMCIHKSERGTSVDYV